MSTNERRIATGGMYARDILAFEQTYRGLSATHEMIGRRRAGKTRSDDDDVGIQAAHDFIIVQIEQSMQQQISRTRPAGRSREPGFRRAGLSR